MKRIKVGTRQSRLALWQTEHVIKRLQAVRPGLECHQIPYVTLGDRSLDRPLPEIGGKGLFTQELEDGLRQGRIDLAVHSLKDLPVEQPVGLTVGAIVGRADVRDVLIAKSNWTLKTLPHGATVGTSSLRRKAQLLAARPDLNVKSIRGNVETRIRKALETDDYHAVVLAAAGVERLELAAYVTQWLPIEMMLPAPGQGALAVQCRAEDKAIGSLLAEVDCADVRDCVSAERAFLKALGGGCALPVAAYARVASGGVTLQATVAAMDGTHQITVSGKGPDPENLGRQLAAEAVDLGAEKLLRPRPLEGKRILVTRSSAGAADFADLLRARGAEPVIFPVIAFEPMSTGPLEAALATGRTYSWLIFTSANAVEYFFAAHRQQPLPRIAAVGAATLSRLRQYDAVADFVPNTFTGEQLALGLGDLSGQRVLLPRARIGRPEIVALLQAQGAVVDDIPLYDTVAASPSAEAIAELARGVEIVTFTSPSSVRNFLRIIADEALASMPEPFVIACIGPSTAAEAEQSGLKVDVVPGEYTIDGLIKALEEYYA